MDGPRIIARRPRNRFWRGGGGCGGGDVGLGSSKTAALPATLLARSPNVSHLAASLVLATTAGKVGV